MGQPSSHWKQEAAPQMEGNCCGISCLPQNFLPAWGDDCVPAEAKTAGGGRAGWQGVGG